jgi:hypothetical protein
MEISCSNCQGKFKIADDKIPPGKAATFPCPKCRTPLTVNSEAQAPRSKVSLDEIDTSAYNPVDRPFDFIE